jgi:hypothetical protein
MIVAMPEHAEPRFASGLLMLADISGYTAFLERVSEAHPDLAAGVAPVPPAYAFMVTLLDLVADEVQPMLRPVQTEGDALFAVGDADVVTNRGREVLDTVGSTYAAYHARIEEQQLMEGDDCSACMLLTSLELKFIVHAGTFVVQQLPNRTHVAGPAVIVAHRLLKNRVTERTGLRGYALMTDVAVELLGLDPSEGVNHLETLDDVGPVSGRVIELARSAGATPGEPLPSPREAQVHR